MTSRIMFSGTLASAAVRRKRKADGAVFAVVKLRDSDRGEARYWTAFANDPAVIEHLEEMRVGEPIAIAGPFSIVIAGAEREPMIEFRITIETLVDTKRRKKPKGQIRKEERVVSDEADQAPRASEADDADSTPPHRQPPGTQSTLAGLDPRINAVAPFNDSIPF